MGFSDFLSLQKDPGTKKDKKMPKKGQKTGQKKGQKRAFKRRSQNPVLKPVFLRSKTPFKHLGQAFFPTRSPRGVLLRGSESIFGVEVGVAFGRGFKTPFKPLFKPLKGL